MLSLDEDEDEADPTWSTVEDLERPFSSSCDGRMNPIDFVVPL